ncbi:hypothetical protein [Streptomyces sp. SID14515]|uniref:hypothetical protein n=1 Tax=Streptomyces sp. SID14515 TaxID=2706074 RepID=UPI0013CBA206|nr:hypothetical protein [Streptomyces sp. SID14515]NEB35899.1 hypothetical protein [Streptomyces sp. SID14515]
MSRTGDVTLRRTEREYPYAVEARKVESWSVIVWATEEPVRKVPRRETVEWKQAKRAAEDAAEELRKEAEASGRPVTYQVTNVAAEDAGEDSLYRWIVREERYRMADKWVIVSFHTSAALARSAAEAYSSPLTVRPMKPEAGIVKTELVK